MALTATQLEGGRMDKREYLPGLAGLVALLKYKACVLRREATINRKCLGMGRHRVVRDSYNQQEVSGDGTSQ